jgi:spore coat assemly protein
MPEFKIDDIVTRKSYGGDIFFKIVDIVQSKDKDATYVLMGLTYRIKADSIADDLLKAKPGESRINIKPFGVNNSRRKFRVNSPIGMLLTRLRGKTGKILHIDSSKEFLDMCMEYYKQEGLTVVGKQAEESEQPYIVRQYLQKYKPDILVMTGHDGVKKGCGNMNSINCYWNSKYFIQSVKVARNYEPDNDKLCIFAGACQSFYEAIMSAGANFASSPERVLINCYDPANVADKVALTDKRRILTPDEVARVTVTGKKGIWGINTRGHMIKT